MVEGPQERQQKEIERQSRDRSFMFMDGHQDRIAGRGLGYLILLNGVAAIVMVGAFVYGFQISAEPKLAAAMLVFGVGAVAALLSSFIAYLNRIVRAEMPDKPKLPSALRLVAIAARDHQRGRVPLRPQHGRNHLDRKIELAAEDKTPGQGLGRTELSGQQGCFPHLSGWG